MPSPLISIITPAYNHERYIADCIRSVIAQSYRNWEMIIVDDGSTDRTSKVIKGFPDSRIKYIHQEHRGAHQLGATYNKALKEAKGDLVAILEGDDFWPPDKLAHQSPYFEDKNVILTYGNGIITNESGDKIFYHRIPADISMRDNSPLGAALKSFIRTENFIFAPTVMIRKSAILKVGGFIQPDYLNLVDFPTWCRLALEGEFKAIPHLLGYWRRNIKSITLSNPRTISAEFIRYVSEFVGQYKQYLETLGIKANQKELQKINLEQLSYANIHRNYAGGLTTLVYGYNKQARQYFRLYLRQKNKGIFNSIISLLCIMFSYTDLLKMLLPFAGVHLTCLPMDIGTGGLLGALKRYLVRHN